MTGYSDAEQLAFATSLERCILTHNREVAKRAGIILNALTADEIQSQLLYA